MFRWTRWLLTLTGCILTMVVAGCGDDLPCPEDLDSSCQPLYPPNFEAIYANTIQKSCAIGGAACHGGEPGQGGLVFAGIDASYTALQPYVRQDEGCSVLLRRISAVDSELQMPPGQRLRDAERCSIFLWLNAGAPR